MKDFLKPISFLILTFTTFAACEKVADESIVLSNEQLTKKIYSSTTNPAAIWVECFDQDQQLIATTSADLPFFEFYLNQELISAHDPIWIKTSDSQRSMANGGTEHTLKFRAAKGTAEGLQVVILQQIFPNSTLIREKIMLEATPNASFQLNKNQGKLHFKFPQYHFTETHASNGEVTEIKLASWELKPTTFEKLDAQLVGTAKKYNHMYYPQIVTQELATAPGPNLKGPIAILSGRDYSWLTAYEHASQDNLNGIVQNTEQSSGNQGLNDPLQGTKGVFDFPKSDDDFRFIDIQYQKQAQGVDVSVDYRLGAYLDGELIDVQHPYAGVWSATAFYAGNDIETGKGIIRNYLLRQICEKPASREPEFYYNTWGMQREVDSRGAADLRGVLTYERIFEEIEYAAELGVDIFVLDDGWEQMQGDWTPHQQRLPQGLAPIKQKLDELGIKMGVWFSPAGIDSTAQRYRQHPEWVILDSEQNPIKAQWGHPAFDMVSDFLEVFIEDCKQLIDEGALFFKWDAINTFYSSLPNLDHGSEEYTPQELRERYAYLLPIYITRAMEVLTDYEPELIIEIDLTEARRVMMGLAPLSQGKLFFMNNGASSYNDYSGYRAMSMRTIPNEYAGIVPLELFTYANYPHNSANSMHYNVHTSLIAGHGFWGNLELTSAQERQEVKKNVEKSKRILPYLVDVNTLVQGKVGDTLEIYTQVNSEQSAGQVFVFNQIPYAFEKKVKVDSNKLLAVLDQPFHLISDTLSLNFENPKNWSSQAAFILPNEGESLSIQSSTCGLDQVHLTDGALEYQTKRDGQQTIKWPAKDGQPQVNSSEKVEYSIEQDGQFFLIKVNTFEQTAVQINPKQLSGS